MTIRAQSADGVIHEFPDGTNPAVIDGAMRAYAVSKKPKPQSFVDQATGFLAKVNRGLGVGDEIAAGVATAADVATGKAPISQVGNAFKRNMASQRNIEDIYQAAHPNMAALATGTGNALTAAVPGGETANVLAQGGRLANAGRGAVTAGLTAAGYAAVDRGSARERLTAASSAARNPIVLGLGAAGGALAPVGPKATAKPKIGSDVSLLAKEGVQMTPGQMRGGLAKAGEDMATSTPILGDAVQGARQRGLETFGRAAVNRALKPVGAKLPEGLVGHDAVAHAQDVLGHAYDNLLPEGGVQIDPAFVQDVRGLAPILETLTPESQKRFEGILRSRVSARVNTNSGVLDGATYKQVQSELGREISRFSVSQDPDHRAIGEGLGVVRDALKNAAARQNPQFADQLAKVDEGYAHLVRAEGAAAKAGADGVFTPAQYDAAVKAANATVRKRGYAAGKALGQDLAKAGRAVLPSKLPDSGTAKRNFLNYFITAPGAAIGGSVGGPVGALAGVGTTIGGLSLASKAYSPKAIDLANKALDSRISRQEASAILAQMSRLGGKDAQLYRQVMARLGRTVAVTATSATNQSPNVLAISSR